MSSFFDQVSSIEHYCSRLELALTHKKDRERSVVEVPGEVVEEDESLPDDKQTDGVPEL